MALYTVLHELDLYHELYHPVSASQCAIGLPLTRLQ
jgi:hypothetical protein